MIADSEKRKSNGGVSELTRVFDVGSTIAVVSIFLGILLGWSDLPREVPSQFGSTGLPSAWGHRAWLFISPTLSLGVYVLLSLGRLSEYDHPRYPVSAGVPSREKFLFSCMKFQMMLIFSYASWSHFLVASDVIDRLSATKPLLFFAMASVLVTGVVWIQLENEIENAAQKKEHSDYSNSDMLPTSGC